MEQTITKHDEQINNLVNQIISNSKDAKWAREMLGQLKGLLSMNKLIDVPMEDVKDTIDLGANKLYRTIRGYAWECKGGMVTFVEHRMTRVCTMLNTIFELHNKEDKTEDEQSLYDSFSTAVAYIMQAPIFSSLDERALFQNATAILSSYTEFCTEHYTNAEAPERTEDDYKEDADAEQNAKAMEILAESPLPPEDTSEI